MLLMRLPNSQNGKTVGVILRQKSSSTGLHHVRQGATDLFLDTYLPFADQNTRLLFKRYYPATEQYNSAAESHYFTSRNLTCQILNRIVRFRWPFLYREFDNKFHMNTKVQLEHYNETHNV